MKPLDIAFKKQSVEEAYLPFIEGRVRLYEKYTKLRDARGVTDYAISKATGIDNATFSNWKAGRYQPKLDKLKKIADYFGVSLDYFVGE